MTDRYVIRDGNVVPEPDLLAWGQFMEDGPARRVAYDKIGDVQVSTVFLGLDHRFAPGLPILWETMIFGGPHDAYQERYTSREDAETGHRRAVCLVKGEVSEHDPVN